MGFLIDTNALIRAEREGVPPSVILGRARVSQDESLAISAVTVSELLVGALRKATTKKGKGRTEAQLQAVRDFAERTIGALDVLPFDVIAARMNARLWAQLYDAGTPLDSHDVMIAATGIVWDLEILTDDASDFARIAAIDPAVRFRSVTGV